MSQGWFVGLLPARSSTKGKSKATGNHDVKPRTAWGVET
jgi:hypothetical protein